jgi:DNA-binding XRE family transcriptional regulator
MAPAHVWCVTEGSVDPMAGQKTNWDRYIEERLQNPEFARMYEEEGQKLDIAMEIARLREKSSMSQAELARRSGTSRQTISRIETGDCSRLNLAALSRIAEALGVSLTVRLGRTPRRSGRARQATT